jgi:hypothetical protein
LAGALIALDVGLEQVEIGRPGLASALDPAGEDEAAAPVLKESEPKRT